MQRGDIIVCVLSGDYGKPRPAVIVQSNLFNKIHDSLTVCPFSTHLYEAPLFRLLLSPNKQNGLKEASQIMIDQMVSLKRSKIRQKIGVLTNDQMNKLDEAMTLWLGLKK